METNQTVKTRNSFLGFIVALMLIIGVALYFVYSEYHTNTTLTAQKIELQDKFTALSDTLDVKNEQIAQLKGKNVELDKAIAVVQDDMTKEKKELSSLLYKNKLTKQELAKAKDMIAQYVASIDDLQKKVADLTQQNQQLTQQNTQLSTNLSAEKQTTSQLTAQNQGLSKKVEVGSLLEIPKVEVKGVKVKNNGKEVAVRKAKAAQSLKISFETGANKVLDTGQVSLFVRVIDPKGETLAEQDLGSGTIQSQEGKGQIEYSKKADIDWNKSNKKVTVYWGANINNPGTYKVELYQTGYLVGSGDVKLN